MTVQDHRPRVAAERRERMRMRLIESALHVFAHKGVDAAVIDDVIERAQVSRGSFYNYYKTNDELMVDVRTALGNEVLALVETALHDREDPAERIALAIRSALQISVKYPLLAHFISRAGIEGALHNSLALVFLPRDLKAGMEAGRFQIEDPSVAFDLILGTTLAALHTIATRKSLPKDYLTHITYHMLIGLGMNKASARRLVNLPLPSLRVEPGTLIARSNQKG